MSLYNSKPSISGQTALGITGKYINQLYASINTMQTNLNISSSSTFQSSLTISGSSIFNSNIILNNNTLSTSLKTNAGTELSSIVNYLYTGLSNVNVSSIATTLVVSGTTSLNSALNVSGLTQINSALNVSGSSIFNSNIILNNSTLSTSLKTNAGTELSSIVNYLYNGNNAITSPNSYLFYSGQPTLYDNLGSAQGTTFINSSGYRYLLFSGAQLLRNGNWSPVYTNGTRLSVPYNGIYTISFGVNIIGSCNIELFISMNSNGNNDLNDSGKVLAVSQTTNNAELSTTCYLTTSDYINIGFFVDYANGTCAMGSRCNFSITLAQNTTLQTTSTGNTILYYNGIPSAYDYTGTTLSSGFTSASGYQYLSFASLLISGLNWTPVYTNNTKLSVPYNGIYTISFGMNIVGSACIELFISKNASNNNDLNTVGKILAIGQTYSDAQITVSCYLSTSDYINVGFFVDSARATFTLGSRCNLSISLTQITSLQTIQNSALQFNNTVTVSGTTALNNTLTVSGNTQINSILNVNNNTTLNSSLTVSGLALLNSTLNVQGPITNRSSLTVSGFTLLNNALTVSGATTLNSTLNVIGNLTVNGSTNTINNTIIENIVNIVSTLTVTGATQLNNTLLNLGAVTNNSSLYVSGNTTLNSTLTINSTSASALSVSNGTSVLPTILATTIQPTSNGDLLLGTSSGGWTTIISKNLGTTPSYPSITAGTQSFSMGWNMAPSLGGEITLMNNFTGNSGFSFEDRTGTNSYRQLLYLSNNSTRFYQSGSTEIMRVQPLGLELRSGYRMFFDNAANDYSYRAYTEGSDNSFRILNQFDINSFQLSSTLLAIPGSLNIGTSGSTSVSTILYSNNATPFVFYNSSGPYNWNIGGNNSGQFVIQAGSFNGVYLSWSTSTWNPYSDIRMKEDIIQLTGCLDKVLKLNPVSYKYINRPVNHNKINFGLIAQEAIEIIPEIVSENYNEQEKGNRYGIGYTEIIPFLIGAIKEQQIEITDLKTRLSNLEALVQTLLNK